MILDDHNNSVNQNLLNSMMNFQEQKKGWVDISFDKESSPVLSKTNWDTEITDTLLWNIY